MLSMRKSLLVLAIAAVFAASTAHAEPTEDQLLATLASKAPAAEKNNACRALKNVGTQKAIPALAALLNAEELGHPARLALESMPYLEASAALREAVGTTSGRLRSGVIDSLGERRDPQGVPVIAPSLADSDPQLIAAAAWALGKIGTSEAAVALQSARGHADGNRRATIGQGLLLCGRTMMRNGKPSEAAAIFAELSAAGEPKTVRLGALVGGALTAGSKRPEVVRSLLADNDPLACMAGAQTLPDLPGAELQAVAKELATLPSASQIAILSAVRIRGDRALLPVVVAGLHSGDEQVAQAAVRAAGAVGDVSIFPDLLELTAHATNHVLSTAVFECIESLSGPTVDPKIIAALKAENDVKRRVAWIEVVRVRRPAGAIDAILSETKHTDAAVRGAAMRALEQLASPAELPGLISGYLAAAPGDEREQAERTIVHVCSQIADRGERANRVLAAIKASHGDQLDLMPLAGRFGGPAVAALVQPALASSDPWTHQAGLQALCNWPDASVAEQLVKLTANAKSPAEREQTLHAYIRVVSLGDDATDAQRLAGLKQAMTLADTDAGRNYILQRSGAVRSIDTLHLLLEYIDRPALAEAACLSIDDLAHHRELRDPHAAEFRPALEKVLKTAQNPNTLTRAKRYLQAMSEGHD